MKTPMLPVPGPLQQLTWAPPLSALDPGAYVAASTPASTTTDHMQTFLWCVILVLFCASEMRCMHAASVFV
jgi:hypothetical protein